MTLENPSSDSYYMLYTSESCVFFPTTLCGVLVFDSVLPCSAFSSFSSSRSSRPPTPHTLHTLCQHTLCQHTLSTHTLSTHTSVNTHFVTTLSTYTLLTHTYIHTHNTHFVNITLSTYTLSTHSVNTHFVNIHFCQHTLCHHFVNIHFAYSHLHTHTHNTHFVNITLCQHTLCQHTLSTHTLSTYTSVNTHFVTTLSTYTLLTHTYIHTHTQHTLCQHTLLSTHTLSPLCQHTLCLLTLTYTHTHTRHTLSTHTLSPHIHLRFAWQAWHNLTSTCVSRGRGGTTSHKPSFCVAGVGQMALGGALGPAWAPVTPRHFAWQAWHNLTCTCVSRGRRGTTSHKPSFHVAGVAQPHINLRFAWQAWDRWHWVARLVRLGRLWRRGTLRGRRGTTSHAPAFHVAGVAQPHINLRFAWQAWDRWHCVARLVRLGRLWRRGTLRGRRGTTSHPPAFHVAGVAQPHINLRFTWQAWYSWYCVARLVRLGRLWRRGTLRGRRGATSHPPAFHVAGVAPSHIHRRFAWQAWDRWHWVARLVRLGRLWRRGTLRGRRGTTSHAPAFHVAGVGTISHPPSFCVAGVGQMALGGALGPAWAPVTPRHFAWQAWHNLTCTCVSRGRRGTISHPPSFCVAGVGQMALGGALGPAWAPVTPRHFAWQAWHNLTCTCVSRGRRGTISHPPSFCVAGVGHMAGFGELRSRQLRYYVCDGTTTTTS